MTRSVHRRRLRVYSQPNLILNPLVYDDQIRNVPCAIARMVRVRLARRGDIGRRCDEEGGSLLCFASEAGDQVPGGGPECRPSGELGSPPSADDKSIWLDESPISRSRR